MSLLRRLIYMGIGGALALALVIGGFVVFAQDDAPTDETPAPEVEDEVAPGGREPRLQLELRGPDDELLAEALGVTVEELAAARDEARAAAVAQAVADGRLTAEEAEALLAGDGRFRQRFLGLGDHDDLLAEALGVTVEALQAARTEARAATLGRLAEDGLIPQEQLDLLTARQAVQGYLDQGTLAQALQNAYQAAIDAALADGAISAEQAEQLQQNLPGFGDFNFFGRGFGGRGGPGRHGFRGGPPDTESDTGIFLPGGRSNT